MGFETVPFLTDHTGERLALDDGAWVDVIRGWVRDPEEAYATIEATVPWRPSTVFRYDRHVEEPRVGSWWRVGDPPPHPLIVEAQRSLQRCYRVRFDGCGLAYYRDERDSVAFHRDRDMQWLDDTIVALVVLGEQRPFLLRPRSNRYSDHLDDVGATHDLAPASGDLLVMGGGCQARWEHSVPKVARHAGGRISLQWRWTSRRGRQERGGSYRKARRYTT